MVVPEVANNFFSRVFSGIESITLANNYHVLIYLTHESYEKEVSFIHHLKNGRVDGVIMSLSSHTKNFDHILSLQAADIPVIFFDRICEEIDTAKITTNDFESSYAATNLLIHSGCKRIAHLTTSLHLTTTQKRRDGYLAACRESNLPIEPELLIHENTEEETEKKLTALLSSEHGADGVFAAVEKLSLITYKVSKVLNIAIPDQLKLIAFANTESANYFSPSLTTIVQPAFEIGREAASILMNHLEKKRLPIPNSIIPIAATIIERDSTKS